jgi:hypothetical protein
MFLGPHQQLKATIFLYDAASNDETTSCHGLVGILWPSVGIATPLSDPHSYHETARFLQAQPFSYSAFHMCIEPSPAGEHKRQTGMSHQNYVLWLAYAVVMVAMSKDGRMVTKLHTGGHLDL